jgi:hypothetical protein
MTPDHLALLHDMDNRVAVSQSGESCRQILVLHRLSGGIGLEEDRINVPGMSGLLIFIKGPSSNSEYWGQIFSEIRPASFYNVLRKISTNSRPAEPDLELYIQTV